MVYLFEYLIYVTLALPQLHFWRCCNPIESCLNIYLEFSSSLNTFSALNISFVKPVCTSKLGYLNMLDVFIYLELNCISISP